ncbi:MULTISPECIES: DUF4113 domain-containing protein [Vibrio]|uniref:DUF4113 domain-containing protein n=1 Tax=Vibrio TaxID=662 RepID=UPI0002F9C1DE|nr:MULTISPECIES: DUF4113 domain-containing protein [Vibrio]
MQALDAVNTKFGRDAVFLAAQGTTQHWQMSRQFLSPQYTKKLKDLPKIQC